MKRFSLSGNLKYAVCMLLVALGGLQQSRAQTVNDLILVEPGGFKLCSNDVKGEEITVYNQSVHPGFKGGTFKVEWGDGTAVENWGSDESRKHLYVPFGVFNLVFSWESADGSKKLSKSYQVMRLTKAMVTLKEGDGGSSCINKDKEIKFVDYQGQTDGTVYFIDYGDGQSDFFKQKEIVEKYKGVIKHRFDTEKCPITVTLKTQNECLDKLVWETTFKTAVVIPPKANFQFIGTGCTGYPVGISNITEEGKDLSCNSSTDYVWKFGDKPSTFEKNPLVSFDTPGEYEIRLIASTGGLECSKDTIVKKVTIVKSPEVKFSIDRDVICSGETVRVTDNSLGKEVRYFWTVTGNPVTDYRFVEGTGENSVNPVVRLDGYGEYTLHLSLRNNCPSSEDFKKVKVLKNPEIFVNNWIDSLCADAVSGTLDLDFKDYVGISWNGNPVKVDWKIEPEAGMPGRVEYLAGTSVSSEYPKVRLTAGSKYKIGLTLDGVSVDGMECGDPAKRTFAKTLKVKDARLVVDVQPDKAVGADGRIQICDGEEIAFVNHSTGERLRYAWSVSPAGTNDPGWSMEYVAGSNTTASPTIKLNGYGDFVVVGRMIADCHEESVSFLVRVMKDPEVFLTNFPRELCPRDVLDGGLCIFYEWYNNTPVAHWEFTPNTVDVVGGGSLDSPEPKIRFRTSEKYTYKVTVPGVGCPDADTVISGELRVRVAGLDATVKEKNNRSEVCEGGMLVFTNSASERDPEGTDLRYEWEVAMAPTGEPQGGAGGDCLFLNGKQNEKVAAVTFSKWGTYDVTAKVIGFCDTVTSTLRIRVKKNPEVVLKDTANCPGTFVLAKASDYEWWNNAPQAAWTISRADGNDQPGDYVFAGNGAVELYPSVEFKRPGKYRVKATLNAVGCPEADPAPDPSADVEYWIYDPVVYGDVTLTRPVLADPLMADICENEAVEFENTLSDEAGSLSWEWEVAGGVADGWRFEEAGTEIPKETGRVKKSPSIRFLKYGDYRVKVTTRSLCNPPKTKEFKVVVRGVPEIVLQARMEKMCADKTLRLEGVLEYADKKNNDLSYEWTVVADRVVVPPVFDPAAEFPVFDFNKENARYTITLKAYSQCAPGGSQTFTSEVDVISIYKKAIFSTDSVGCTDFELTLENASVGDSLSYSWDVQAVNASGGGWAYAVGDEHAEKPQLKITEAGFYDISLEVSNICGTDTYTNRVKAFSVPDVKIADISDVCEPLAFVGKDRISVDEHNDPVNRVTWTITPRPGSVSEGFEYVNGTSSVSAYPDVVFKACDYEVKVEYGNRCPEPGRATFSVRVDKFVPIEPLEDKALCVLSPAFELQALPAGGEWTLKDGTMPGADRILYRTADGKDWFDPQFDPYFEGDVELVYSKANFTCMARDTMKVHIWPLPRVEAGVDLSMCVNDPPFLLENGSPKNGYWTRENGSILGGDYYTVEGDGDYKLRYYFTDRNGCVNVDSSIMTVHPLPNTKFEVKPLNCIRTEVEIKPEQLDGNRFAWDYGDGSPKEVSKGDTVHVYGDFGFRKVSNITTSKYGCVKRSDSVEIEIVNVPPPAFFEVDTLKGCARFGVEPGNESAVLKVSPSVNAATYADNHNYLSFKWEYGDGTTSDELPPLSPIYYPSGSWDTTYHLRFTVSNMCGMEEHEKDVTVLSAPKVKFALKHEWECTPVVLELQNTTTGNNVVFDWMFENKRTGAIVKRTNVRNPVHEFTTDSASTTYYITLKASNACDDDVHTDSLVVKPRTISAHFTPSKRNVCVGEEICFKNNSTDTLSAIENIYWNFGDGGRDTLWNPCHVYQSAQDYVVSLLIDNGCGFHSVADTIQVHPLPRLDLLSEDHLCEADTFTFVVYSDQELKRVTWDFGDGLSADRDSVLHLYEGYGKRVVKVTGVSARIAACVAEATKDIEIYNKPIVTILPLDTAHCSPFPYKPETTGEGFFMWDFGDGSQLSSTNEHYYENATDTVQKFHVRAYVETDKGCKSEYDRNVTVYYLPKAVIGKEVTKGKPEKVAFLNLSEKSTDAFWELPFKGAVHSVEGQSEEFHENGLYRVGLVAESYHGCRDTAELEHLVQMKGLYFPNTFIPGSTNGRVSRFNGIAIGLKEYWLEIYDFYGNKIWETKALENGVPSEGWDGRNSKGELLPQGTYVWRARAIFVNDEVWTGKNNDANVRETVQGTVLLLRE